MNNPNILSGKKIVSGITPSGDGTLHIGNYLGAVRQFVEIAKNNRCYLFVADLHALTTIQDRKQLMVNTENLILNELALLQGFLNEKQFANVVFFRQSDIGYHPELQTIINNVTPLGLLRRAHAYKDKLARDVMEDDINLGLFNYPVLMAADILMYKPDLVPVGRDQKQHVEIARDIAERFNKTYGKMIFPLPDAYIPEEVATVTGTDGQRKMSKSLGNIISIFEDENTIKKQVNSCFTDPTRKHASDPGHIEGNMVFTYLDYFGDQKQVAEYKSEYQKGKVGDVEVKDYLYTSLLETFKPARERYRELKANPGQVTKILAQGAEAARVVAAQTMAEVHEAVGLVNKFSDKSQNPKAVNNGKINVEDFGKVEIRIGKVEQAENVENSQKLIILTVSFGDLGTRTIYTGVRGYGYTPEDFHGKQFLFVTNLAPRKMPGGESQGMILAVDGLDLTFGEHGEAKPVFISGEGLPVGAKVR